MQAIREIKKNNFKLGFSHREDACLYAALACVELCIIFFNASIRFYCPEENALNFFHIIKTHKLISNFFNFSPKKKTSRFNARAFQFFFPFL